jgi:nitroreductase
VDFKQVVGSRRTIRYFKSWQPVEPAKIQGILEAGRLQSQHGNAKLIRKAVVIERGKTPDGVRDALIDAMYNQPQVQQAPVFIVWAIDMSGWDSLRDTLKELIEVRALNSTHGWSKEFIETAVIPNPDFNVLAGERGFAEWLSAFECGLAVGSALLAAVDEGLGTALVTGRRAQIREIPAPSARATWTTLRAAPASLASIFVRVSSANFFCKIEARLISPTQRVSAERFARVASGVSSTSTAKRCCWTSRSSASFNVASSSPVMLTTARACSVAIFTVSSRCSSLLPYLARALRLIWYPCFFSHWLSDA